MKWKTSITKIEDDKEIVRGHNLQELVMNNNFVQVIYLILKSVLPSAAEEKMLNALFVTCIDHGVGAPSATVTRTVYSTGNSLHTALAAGVLTMGELHGGAIEGAAKFFQENVNVADVDGLVAELKANKVRIPGYGHKVLAHDHRSDSLFTVAKETGFYGKHSVLAISIGEALNKISSKPLPINIDGAMGAIISDMGFEWQLAKGFFIIGRVPGLVAQIFEESKSGAGLRRISEEEIEYLS